jgi:biopolymer transport protein ExbD
MQLGGSGGVKSDINVTPLVDVMLVLLIIMMIVAPLLQQGVAVTLPVATNTSEKPETQEQTVVAITADKRFFVNAVQVQQADLGKRIMDLLEEKKEKIVIIKADEDVEYGAVMEADGYAARGWHPDMGPSPRRASAAERNGGQQASARKRSSRQCRRPTRI